MKGVLVTHADSRLGLAVAHALARDGDAERLLLVASGPPPRAFEAWAPEERARAVWVRADLGRHRQVTDLFDSAAFDAARVEAAVWVPEHGAPDPAPPGPAGVPARVRELRALLHHLRETPRVKRLVALVSAAVYRLPPGNASRAEEGHELELSPEAHPEVRSWVDCDVMLREEVRRAAPFLVLLRVPAVIAADGSVHLHPALGAGSAPVRPLGFDPLWSVVAADDVALAARLALRAPAAGVFNVAGDEALPLSWLLRWSGRAPWPVPGPLLGAARGALRRLGARETARALDPAPLSFGLTLDGRRAATALGFRPRWRVALPPRGTGGVLRLEPLQVAAPGWEHGA